MEVVDIPPYFEKARRNWAKLGIAGKEALLQGPEEGAEGKLYLRMAKVGRGIEKGRNSSLPTDDVAVPEIAMKQGCRRWLLKPPVELPAQALQPFQGLVRQLAAGMSTSPHGHEALIAEKGNPRTLPTIILWQGADRCRTREAESLSLNRVQGGDPSGCIFLSQGR